MGLSVSWADSIEIIHLQPVRKILGIKPMDHIAPMVDSLEIIAFQT